MNLIERIVDDDFLSVESSYKFTQYCPNKTRNGSVLHFIESECDGLFVLKSHRDRLNTSFNNPCLDRVLGYSLSLPELVFPNNLEIGGVQYEYQRFVQGKSMLTRIRYSIWVSNRQAFLLAMRLCDLLLEIKPKDRDLEHLSKWYCSHKTNTLMSVPVSLVHNDLSPANIYLQQNKPFLLDWEDADFAPSVFNFFEFLFHHSSLYFGSRFRRRSIQHYRQVFKQINSKAKPAFKALIKQRMFLYLNCESAETAEEALRNFILYKSELTGGVRDNLWVELAECLDSIAVDLRYFLSCK